MWVEAVDLVRVTLILTTRILSLVSEIKEKQAQHAFVCILINHHLIPEDSDRGHQGSPG